MLARIKRIAERFATAGWTLRTGLSPGADQAFYAGALARRGRIELFLPSPRFQQQARSSEERGLVTVLAQPSEAAFALAQRTHPHWEQLDHCERSLRARDCHQVLGADLRHPVDLVVCWTADGGIDGLHPLSGGTGQALRIASLHRIAVINLGG